MSVSSKSVCKLSYVLCVDAVKLIRSVWKVCMGGGGSRGQLARWGGKHF